MLPRVTATATATDTATAKRSVQAMYKKATEIQNATEIKQKLQRVNATESYLPMYKKVQTI